MFLIFLLILITPLFIYLKSYKRRYDIGKKIQGPPTWPIIGYAKMLTASPTNLLSMLMELQKEYDGLYKLWLFMEFWVITNDPNLVEKILNNQQALKADDYELLKPWLGTGLLTSEGKKWFNRRKIITPAFHFKILEDFIKIFEKHTKVLIEKFRTDQVVDVTTHLPLYTLDTICETAMGIDIKAQTDEDSAYVKAVHKVAEISYSRMFNPFLKIDFIFRWTKDYPVLQKYLKVIHTKTQSVIEMRRACLEQEAKPQDATSIDDLGRKRKMALLDILLKASSDDQPLSDSDIQEEVNTFMFAGHDTTATACGFLLYNIAKYPEIQQKLINEIRDVLGKESTTELTVSTLNDFRYLDLVVKESLRFHTTVPLIGRQIIEETQINDYLFPQNTNVTLNVYGMCHSENLFPDPGKFIPERFDVTNEKDDDKKPNPYTFIPFSAGPRNCIGQKFALIEIKLLAIRILQNFEISLAKPDEDLILAIGVTLKVNNGIHLRFKKRL